MRGKHSSWSRQQCGARWPQRACTLGLQGLHQCFFLVRRLVGSLILGANELQRDVWSCVLLLVLQEAPQSLHQIGGLPATALSNALGWRRKPRRARSLLQCELAGLGLGGVDVSVRCMSACWGGLGLGWVECWLTAGAD